MRAHLRLLLVAVALVAAACGQEAGTTAGGGATEPTTAGATTDAAAAAATDATAAATVAVASSDLGEILVDGEGMSLYLFTNDEQGGPSTCTDDCAANWPPLQGPATAGDGADESLLDVVDRDDGTQQVTYNGWPLYYFAADEQPGDVSGQGVGDVWFAVDASGEAVTEEAAAKEEDDGY